MDKYFKFDDLTETIPVKFDHIEIDGCTMIESWDNVKGFIDMKPFDINISWEKFRNIDHDEFINLIKNGVNDNGFGCKEIIGAHVWVKAVYYDDLRNRSTRIIDDIYLGISRDLTIEDINDLHEWDD